MIELHHGDSLKVLPTLPSDSVHSIVTDPPYGLSFMGKDWDHGVPGVAFWREALRVAKPGAHLLAFGGTRTFHRLAVAIEDAGWEIRDTVMWVYGSGFPKSLNVSKAIDKAAGAEREVIGSYTVTGTAAKGKHKGRAAASADEGSAAGHSKELMITAAATEAAKEWEGWGTALKPAWEPIIVARKPLVGTVAENVLKHGTGALNIDGSRVGTESTGWNGLTADRSGSAWDNSGLKGADGIQRENVGRWPANVIHDASEEVIRLFPQTKSTKSKAPVRGKRPGGFYNVGSEPGDSTHNGPTYDDEGTAARFFYSPKANKRDRDEGLHNHELAPQDPTRKIGDPGGDNPRNRGAQARANHHPTVKPTELMRYLCRLVTPPNGIILDPFMGSGSTGKAAVLDGYQFIGIDLQEEYVHIARARIQHAATQRAPE